MAKWILDGGHSSKDSSDIGNGSARTQDEGREAVLQAKSVLEAGGEEVLLVRTHDIQIELGEEGKFVNRWDGDFLVIPLEEVNQNIRGFRVCIGYFDEFEEAKQACNNAKDKGVKGVYIMPNLK